MPVADPLSALWACGSHQREFTASDWQRLLGQARVSNLEPRLAIWCAQRLTADGVPPGPRAYLDGMLGLARRRNDDVRREVARIQRALAGLDAPVVLLKGAAYLMAGLPAAQGRLFADVDLLVPKAHLAAAEDGLFREGWIPGARDDYNDRYYRQWMHELPPLVHVTRGSTIDLHHTITPPTSAFNVDGGVLLAAARPLAGQAGLWVLQPVDMVLHSAVHLFGEGEFDHGLRDLMDMDLLLRHFEQAEPGFWQQLFDRADELRLQVPLHHALFHVARLFGTRAPAEFNARATALQPAWLPRTLMAHMLAVALRPQHPSCRVRGEGLVRWLLYVRSHWLRMPLHLLVPHLVRKAWMSRFPDPPKQAATGLSPARPVPPR